MKNKIKFINAPEFWDIEEDMFKRDFKIVPNPLPQYKKLPFGEYLIRGNKKDHSIEYWHYNNVWYLIEEVTKDNGHYLCRAAEYVLFPPLSEKQWNLLNSIPRKCLTKTWQRYLFGYNFYMKLKETKRNAMKARFEMFDKI